MEYSVEWPLLKERWKLILLGLIFQVAPYFQLFCLACILQAWQPSELLFYTLLQYLHGLAARGVHYLHKPGPVLQDIGFILFPVSLQIYLSCYCLRLSL